MKYYKWGLVGRSLRDNKIKEVIIDEGAAISSI